MTKEGIQVELKAVLWWSNGIAIDLVGPCDLNNSDYYPINRNFDWNTNSAIFANDKLLQFKLSTFLNLSARTFHLF